MLVDKRDKVVNHRSCTDIPCCLVFIGFIVAFFGVLVYAVVEGDPRRLYHGFSYAGKLCGVDVDVANKPYLYWPVHPDFYRIDLSTPICVDRCFTQEDVDNKVAVKYPVRQTTISTPAGPVNIPSWNGALENATSVDYAAFAPAAQEATPITATARRLDTSVSMTNTVVYKDSLVYKTVRIGHAYCMPFDAELAQQVVEKKELDGFYRTMKRAIASLEDVWPMLIVASFVALGLAFAYLWLLDCCALFIVYSMVALCVVTLCGLGYYMLHVGFMMDKPAINGTNIDESQLIAVRVAGVVFTILGIAVAFFAMCSQAISVAVGVIEAACEAMFDMPKILLNPLINFVFQLIVYAIGITGMLYIMSMGQISPPAPKAALGFGDNGLNSVEVYGIHRKFEMDDKLWGMLAFYFFGMLWFAEFIVALGQFVTSYSMVLWYFTRPDAEGDREVSCPLWKGFSSGLFYHTGSLALGSFLVATCRFIRAVLEVIRQKVKQAGQANNHVVQMIINALQCVVACFECLIRYLNNNAYIEMAINSTGYCTSAGNAVVRLLKAAPAVAVLNGATKMFSFVGVLIVSSLTSLGIFALISNVEVFTDHSSDWFVDSPIIVVVFAFLMSAMISILVMDVFDQTTDTLLICFLVEQEEGRGWNSMYAPERLRHLIHTEGHAEATELAKRGVSVAYV